MAAMTDYCAVPPFVQTTVTPNVMVLIDFSGSMQFPAYLGCNFNGYSNSTSQCWDGSTALTGTNYSASTTYYGYFDVSSYYQYDSTNKYFTVNSSCSYSNNIGAANCISGNLLNWATATRVDVARKVMTGGRTAGTGTGTYLDSEGADYKYSNSDSTNSLYCTFQVSHQSTSTPTTRRLTIANVSGHTCTLGSLSNAEIQIQKDPTTIKGTVDDFYDKVTFDFMYFNSDNKGVIPTGGIKGAALTDLKTAINTQLPYNGTPTGEALWEVYDFYQQSNGHSYVSNSSAISQGTCAKDPFYDCSGSTSVAMPCRKSFVLLLSDGGFNGDVDPVVSARNLRRGDLRSDTLLTSSQNVTVYPVFTFGDLDPGYKAQGKVSLIMTAIFGGYTNYSTDSFPYPFTGYTEGLSTDCGSTYDNSAKSNIVDGSNTWCNSRAFNNGNVANVNYFHSKCNPAGSAALGTYDERCKGWDPQKTGFPYNFFSANDGSQLETAVINALTDMTNKVNSGTAASVLASSEGSGANILQAIFFPKRNFGATEVLWTGQMQNLWYYIDPNLLGSAIFEDTVQDAILDTSNDDVIGFFFDDGEQQVRVSKSTFSGTSVGTFDFDQISNLAEVGNSLFLRTDARTIYTTLDGANFTNFSASTASTSSTFRTYLQAADATEATKIVNFVSGTDQTGYRSRTVTIGANTGPWRLGDIIDSTPRAQTAFPINSYHLAAPNGYSDLSYSAFTNTTSYKNRGTAFVGANDGMLHAFNIGVLLEQWSGKTATQKAKLAGSNFGSETWAFIPKNALPYLKYLADPNYCHLYYVNAPMYLVEASVGTTGQGDISANAKLIDGSSWKTILIGGSGLGGSCKAATTCGTSDCVQSPITGAGLSSYFAIDVTDASNPVLLWEFSDENLGFSTSGPAIVKLGRSSTNGKWFAVFASGPTGTVDTAYHQFLGRSDQTLKLFVLDLKTGQPYTFAGGKKYYDTGIANAFGGSLYNSFIDLQKGEPTAIDQGNYQDDAFYLGYTSKCLGTEPTGTPCTTGTWTNGGVLRILTKENTDPTQWSVTSFVKNVGPVTTAVTKLQDRGAHPATAVRAAQPNPYLILYFGTGRFYYKRGAELDDPSNGRTLYAVSDPCYQQDHAGQPSHASFTASCAADNGTILWQKTLDAGERVITDPVATFSGNVFFTTFAPSADACTMGGYTYLWAIDYVGGGAATSPPARRLLCKYLPEKSNR